MCLRNLQDGTRRKNAEYSRQSQNPKQDNLLPPPQSVRAMCVEDVNRAVLQGIPEWNRGEVFLGISLGFPHLTATFFLSTSLSDGEEPARGRGARQRPTSSWNRAHWPNPYTQLLVSLAPLLRLHVARACPSVYDSGKANAKR